MYLKSLLLAVVFTAASIFSDAAMAKLRLFACEPEWAALASELSGDLLSITTATTAFQDVHFIEARPSLIAAVRNADLVFCTGAELEIGWLPLLLRQSGNSRVQENQTGYFLAAEQVGRIDVPEVLDRSMGDVHASGNPHVHLDPYRLLIIAEKFSQRLQLIDQDNKKVYQDNFTNFSLRWMAAIASWELKASPLKGKRAFIQHGHSKYLLNWLGIEIVADLEPKPGLPPGSTHLTHLLKINQKSPSDFIILAAYQSDKGARWLSGRQQLPVVILPYTVGGNEQARDIFSLYESTIELLLAEIK